LRSRLPNEVQVFFQIMCWVSQANVDLGQSNFQVLIQGYLPGAPSGEVRDFDASGLRHKMTIPTMLMARIAQLNA